MAWQQHSPWFITVIFAVKKQKKTIAEEESSSEDFLDRGMTVLAIVGKGKPLPAVKSSCQDIEYLHEENHGLINHI